MAKRSIDFSHSSGNKFARVQAQMEALEAAVEDMSASSHADIKQVIWDRHASIERARAVECQDAIASAKANNAEALKVAQSQYDKLCKRIDEQSGRRRPMLPYWVRADINHNNRLVGEAARQHVAGNHMSSANALMPAIARLRTERLFCD